MRAKDAKHARPLARAAIDAGITFFDTANIS
jgi:aryl-alcohol dehydrogenase-like predicted oxidoreductase